MSCFSLHRRIVVLIIIWTIIRDVSRERDMEEPIKRFLVENRDMGKYADDGRAIGVACTISTDLHEV